MLQFSDSQYFIWYDIYFQFKNSQFLKGNKYFQLHIIAHQEFELNLWI